MVFPNYEKISQFLFEMGELKYIKRSGWWNCKIKDPESVAEHSFRTSIIAFVLAKLDGKSEPEKIAFAALIHDVSESRLLDLHLVSAHYVENKKEIEERIFASQLEKLGIALPSSKSNSALIKDADLLEMAFTAKEYIASGNPLAKVLFVAAGKKLSSKSARKLYSQLKKTNPQDWWINFIEDNEKK